MERSNFPHRNLDEDDEELLNGIWAGLETPDDRPGADSRDFDDVKRRIRRRVRRRWMSRATLAGSAAAIVAAVVLVVRQPGVLPEPDAFAQLQQMGVTVERPQVVMTADDGMRLVLENAARLERRSEGEVALRTETGEQRPLATERKLKVEVPNGRQFRLVLDDGSEVWLNAGSKLEYPATFENASERCVRIEGEAFFEIKRDTCRPFCVELGDGECIRVLGTSFNVNAYAGNGRHVTTLVTGRIGYAASAGAEEVVLEPNQQVSRDLAAGTVAVRVGVRRVERGLAVVRERKPARPGRASGAHIRHPGGGGRPARGVYLLRENPPGQGRRVHPQPAVGNVGRNL